MHSSAWGAAPAGAQRDGPGPGRPDIHRWCEVSRLGTTFFRSPFAGPPGLTQNPLGFQIEVESRVGRFDNGGDGFLRGVGYSLKGRLGLMPTDTRNPRD